MSINVIRAISILPILLGTVGLPAQMPGQGRLALHRRKSSRRATAFGLTRERKSSRSPYVQTR